MAKQTRGTSPAKKHVPARNGATVVRVKNRPLRDLTEEALQCYFTELNGHRPGDLYELVLGEIETALNACDGVRLSVVVAREDRLPL